MHPIDFYLETPDLYIPDIHFSPQLFGFVFALSSSISLAGNDDPFNEGYTSGYLEFYDERRRPFFPLTSHVIRDHLMMIINESSCSELWNAGRVTGWIEALIENSPQTFRSFIPGERMTFL